MTTPEKPLALVIGATGGVGGAVADRLVVAGWRVRAMNRNPDQAKASSGRSRLDWVPGDAMIEADVIRAAEGCDLIVHGANPPGYKNWAGLAVPMLRNTIAAAKASGARILFPGNVYNFGPDAWPSLTETSPQNPLTRKGNIRVGMEQALSRAATEGVKVLIVRAGDFFAPQPGSNWLSMGMLKTGRPLTSVSYPGPLAIDHAWAYLPDLAETMVRLAELPNLADFEVFHFRGHSQSGHMLIAALERLAGRKLAVSRLPWPAIRAIGLFNESFREMLEMRYLWDETVLLDNSKLVARLGAEPHTPLDTALRSALQGLSILPTSDMAIAA